MGKRVYVWQADVLDNFVLCILKTLVLFRLEVGVLVKQEIFDSN